MRRLQLLDYGRLAAAVAVMISHYFYTGILYAQIAPAARVADFADVARFGYLGVSFFFLISGYVIFYSAKGKTPGEFAASRLLRLYPAFWVCMLATSAFALVWGGPKTSVTPHQVLVNLTMISERWGVPFVDSVYWTLHYELKFYGMVLVLLFLGLQRRLEAVFLAWPVVMLLAWLAGKSHLSHLGGYYAFFAAGAIFAILRERPSPVAYASLAAAFVVALDHMLQDAKFGPEVVALIVVAQFAFFFVLNTDGGQVLSLPGSRLAGGLTYPLYLLHANIGYMLLSRFVAGHHALAYVLLIAFVFGLAYMVHEYVERRPARFWTAVFRRGVQRPIDRVWAVAQRGVRRLAPAAGGQQRA